MQAGNNAAVATPDITQLLAGAGTQQYGGFGSSQNPPTPQSMHVSSFVGSQHAIPGGPGPGTSTGTANSLGSGSVSMNKSQAPVVQPDMQELMAQLSKYNRAS
jgi:hypothetical protein